MSHELNEREPAPPRELPEQSRQLNKAADSCGRSAAERRLILLLRLVGLFTLLAFAAAVMPQQWIVETAEALGFDPFPDSPLTFYLARSLSLLYGFIGVGLLVLAADFDRYRPLVRYLAVATIAFGVLQLLVDAQSAMPAWWTLSEFLSTVFGGVLIWWMDRAAATEAKQASGASP